jgi:hypothetical protein
LVRARTAASTRRSELAILGRQPRRAPIRPVDRAFLARLPRRCRGAPGQAYRCVRRRFCAGTGSWSGGAGGIRTDLRGGGRSIVGCRRSLFGSHARTHLGATGGSSANLRGVGVSISATSVRTILIRHGLPPARQRDQLSWRLAETHLRALLPFAGEPPDRVRRLHCEPDRRLDGPTSAQLLMTVDHRQQPLRLLIDDRDAKSAAASTMSSKPADADPVSVPHAPTRHATAAQASEPNFRQSAIGLVFESSRLDVDAVDLVLARARETRQDASRQDARLRRRESVQRAREVVGGGDRSCHAAYSYSWIGPPRRHAAIELRIWRCS